ncbi:MAG: TonB-dependent receptor [Chitinophagaceae bacterium]|nr:TonB-dependent receptor [Chitinophagaceae bacterium]
MKKLLLSFLVSLFFSQLIYAQERVVTGKVTSAKEGTPVEGATVRIKGTSGATVTTSDGTFRITIQGNNAVLIVSGVGLAEKEVAVGNSSNIDVVLEEALKTLQEVFVTGYTTQNKRQVAGSISKLSGDEIKMQPVGSFDQALQGKVPGLLSQSQSGQPGAAAAVSIRGKGSINGTNTPLYVVDGVQVNAADFATVNPGDIESYNVLKDASATSIYGSRGANGVIVITTKKGSAGKTQINYDFQVGYSELPKNRLELMNSAEKLDYEVNYDRPLYGTNPFGWTQADIDSLGKINNNLDKVLFRKGLTHSHQLSASGGNDKTKFYLSLSYFDQEGIVLTTGLKRYTGRVNIENSFGDFKVGLNSAFGYSRLINTRENDAYIGSPLNAVRWFNPYITLYDADGNYQDDFLQGQPNPLRELLENFGNSDQLKGIGNIYLEYKIPLLKGLKFRTNLGADYSDNDVFAYFDRSTDQGGQATGNSGAVNRAYSKNFRYTSTTSFAYQNSWGDHDLNAAIFNEVIENKFKSFGFSGFGLLGPFKNEAGITPGSPTNNFIPTVTGNGTRNALLSYFADAVYGFRKKYYLNAGFRRDGSSRLSQDKKWANFAQVGFSWIISEENFLSKTEWLNELKWKVSYGSVGSQGVGNFASRELLNSTVYNGTAGLLLTSLSNPNLTWERKLMFNSGVEFTMFRGRLGGTVEVYSNTTNDLFLDRQLSRTSGFPSITTNLGKLRNQGIEVSLRGDVFKSKDFTWSLGGNYTYNKNKIISQPGQPENVQGLVINKEGERANSLYLVRYAGVDPQTGNSLYYKTDGKTTTDVYDPSDRVIVGTIDPPHYGGLFTDFSYKGIELNVLFSYAFGNVIYNNDRINVEFPGYWYSGLAKSVLREWQNPGDVTDIPSSFDDFQGNTTRFVESGDYLRLRNVTLSYNLPQSLLSRLKIRSIRVFAQGQNLYVWHKFQGYDPEIVTGSLSGAQYPQLKTITFGLNIGL